MTVERDFSMAVAVSAFLKLMRRVAWWRLVGESFVGQPPIDFGR